MTSTNKLKQSSKFLSLILRHKPEEIGLTLDDNGWAIISELIQKANNSKFDNNLNYELIEEIVKTNDKKRFIISEDKLKIRANQGHSIKVDLQLNAITPPDKLYHGTATRFLDSILEEGLKPQNRQHVHLSENINTATEVGKRYGKPVILAIDSETMNNQGLKFYQSENGVWLCEFVSKEFIALN